MEFWRNICTFIERSSTADVLRSDSYRIPSRLKNAGSWSYWFQAINWFENEVNDNYKRSFTAFQKIPSAAIQSHRNGMGKSKGIFSTWIVSQKWIFCQPGESMPQNDFYFRRSDALLYVSRRWYRRNLFFYVRKRFCRRSRFIFLTKTFR